MKIFLNHIEKFCRKHSIFPQKGEKIYLGVSAGKDSMALLECFYQWFKEGKVSSLVVLHINHGTRAQNQEEEELIINYTKEKKIPLKILRLEDKLTKKFSELMARDFRYRFFSKYLKEDNSKLYLAHHLDDSFEWHLMQQFKSSNLVPGIPLRRGKIARPFMCLSKQQIEYFIKKTKTPYLEDPSNTSIDYERNYLRHKIIRPLKEKYQSCLKHYVKRANLQAKIFLDLSKKDFGVTKEKKDQGQVTYTLPQNSLKIQEELIFYFKGELKKLSTKKAGNWHKQLENMLNSHHKGKKGPLNFSGGISARMRPYKITFSSNILKSLL